MPIGNIADYLFSLDPLLSTTHENTLILSCPIFLFGGRYRHWNGATAAEN
jgi:hypothetical protein